MSKTEAEQKLAILLAEKKLKEIELAKIAQQIREIYRDQKLPI